MIMLIKRFIYEWAKFPSFKKFEELSRNVNPEEYQKGIDSDLKRGIKPYRNRLDYAVRNTKMHWKYRDRYGRKCRAVGGDCDKCKAKHC